jgi:hypothetical protein
MTSAHRLLALVAVASALVSRQANAQDSPPQGGDNQGGAPAPTQPAPPSTPGTSAAAPTTPGATYFSPLTGFGNPQSSNGTIGGGNATESSSHPRTGEEEDSFDFGKNAGQASAAHGSEQGPIFTTGGVSGRVTEQAPGRHTVQHGDTLWSLCGRYLQNPYDWPRVWSYNPQIKNPNWIFPGDEIRLRPGDDKAEAVEARSPGAPARRERIASDTVFLREQGWIEDSSDQVWGEVSGSPQDTMFLSELNEVYLALRTGHDVIKGQELTIFRIRETVAGGSVVQILGTARVDGWDPDSHLARAKIVESLDVIERGAKVGPVIRSFTVVPSRRDEADVQARVVAALHPAAFYGQNQVVFIDKGEAAGLVPGNRLLIMRRGDAWRESLVTPVAGYRISPDDERPMPPMEQTPGVQGDPKKYPEEVVAELRVLSTKKQSAACLVTQSRHEIEAGDRAVATQGY